MPKFRIFVLGAGFSKPAGLPLGNELWPEIRKRASRMPGEINHLESDIDNYIRFRRECYGDDIAPEEVEFENFLGYLDIEHYLGLRGSKQWDSEGNESQMIVKAAIGQILTERTPHGQKLPQLYLDFAEELCPCDYVLTFNYDVLLERALQAVGSRFRLFPNRYTQKDPAGGTIDSLRELDEIAVLKMHGSVDWFDRGSYSDLEESNQRNGFSEKPPHAVFGPDSIAKAVPLLEGPQYPDDPLRHMYRVHNVDSLYASYAVPSLLGPIPWILNPSTAKVIYAEKMRDFWWGMGQAGGWILGVNMIGYSLPKHDDYIQQALFSLITNYQNSWWEAEYPDGRRKQPVLLIDFRPDAKQAEDYRRRYRFVNGNKAVYHLAGFNEEALSLIRTAPSSAGH